MTAHSEATATLGHNNPPQPTLAERLTEISGPLLTELEALADLANKAPKEVTTEQDVVGVTKIAADAGALRKTLDATRSREKGPFLQAERDVDNHFRQPIERADKIDKALMARVTAFRRKQAVDIAAAKAEAERKVREAAEAARSEAAAAAQAGRTEDALAALEEAVHADDRADDIAQAPQVYQPQKLQHESGLTAGVATEWKFEIVDYDAIPLDKLRQLINRDAVEAALRQFVKNGNRELPGVRIYEDVKATRRR